MRFACLNIFINDADEILTLMYHGFSLIQVTSLCIFLVSCICMADTLDMSEGKSSLSANPEMTMIVPHIKNVAVCTTGHQGGKT